VQVAELPRVHGAGRAGHQLLAAIVFREGNDVANRVGSGDEHDEAVDAEGDAAVGRRAEAEGVQQMPEERLLVGLADPERGEHLPLQIGLVDSQAAAAEFESIEDDVVGDRADAGEFTGFEFGKVPGHRPGEGVVNGVPAVFLGVPAQERKLGDPQEIELRRIGDELLKLGDAKPHAAEDFANRLPRAGAEEDEIALLDAQARREGGLLRLGEEFDDR